MRHATTAFLLLTLCLFAASCDSGGADKSDPTLDGTWRSVVETESGTLLFEVLLSQEGASVDGTGEVGLSTTSGLDQASVDVSGTHSFPDVRMTLDVGGQASFAFRGTLSEDGQEMQGRLGNAEMRWVRQQPQN